MWWATEGRARVEASESETDRDTIETPHQLKYLLSNIWFLGGEAIVFPVGCRLPSFVMYDTVAPLVARSGRYKR